MAPMVREAFELYATGNYSLIRLVDEIYRRGLRNRDGRKVSLNGLSTMLNNPFYTGLIRIKKTGDCFPGAHAPIIGTRLFDIVQHILDGKVVVRTKRHEFAFSRMIRCGLCGKTVMAEIQKGHVYYRCHTDGCETKTIREERIEQALESAFAPLRLNEDESAYVKEWFARARANAQAQVAEKLEAYRLQIAQTRDRLARLTDAYLDGTIDKSVHAERRARLILEENELKRRLQDIEPGSDETLAHLEKYLELIQTASNLYKLALTLEKRALVKKLTSNLSVMPKKPMITLRNAAQLIANRPQFLSGSPHRDVPRTWEPLLKEVSKAIESDEMLHIA